MAFLGRKHIAMRFAVGKTACKVAFGQTEYLFTPFLGYAVVALPSIDTAHALNGDGRIVQYVQWSWVFVLQIEILAASLFNERYAA